MVHLSTPSIDVLYAGQITSEYNLAGLQRQLLAIAVPTHIPVPADSPSAVEVLGEILVF